MSSKAKLIRILEILEKTDEQHPLTIPEILSQLKLYGIEAERKSVAYDMQILDDSGYSIVSAGKHLGFYMTEHTFEDYELKIIADAVCSARFITAKDSLNLISKLKSIATPTGEKILSDMLYLDNDIKTDNNHSKYTVDKIITAIKTNKKISFKYYDYDSNYKRVLRRNGHLYSVSPYYLVWSGEDYFMLGSPDSHSNLTHFQISMMVDTAITDEPRKSRSEIVQLTADFDLGKYIRETVNMFTGEVAPVTLKCHNSMLREIRRRFGKNTRISKIDASHFTTTVKVTHNDGLYQYLMQYSQLVQVTSPAHVRDKIKELLSDALSQYSDG